MRVFFVPRADLALEILAMQAVKLFGRQGTLEVAISIGDYVLAC